MIGRKQELHLQINQILDSLVLFLAFWFSHSIRFYVAELNPAIFQIPKFGEFLWIMAIIIPFTPLVLELHSYYKYPLQKTILKSLGQILRAFFWIAVVIAACVIFFRWENKSRSVLIIFTFVGSALLLLKEALVRAYLRRQVEKGEMRERVLVVGFRRDIDKFREAVPPDERQELEIVEEIELSREPVEKLIGSMRKNAVGRVIFAVAHAHFGQIEEGIRACEAEGVEAWLCADFMQTSIARPTFDSLGSRPMLVFRTTPELSWALLIKQVIDRLGALGLIVLSSPLWLLAWIGIHLSSRGPAFFRQERAGRYGKPFTMIKFRTMSLDAEGRREELEKHNEMDGPVFKVEKDPRIFRFGRFLRRFSIDELPQLLNVLLGDMSLVGPRPLPVYEVEKIQHSTQRRRLSVKPGITCLWQISGRNKITNFEDWVQLDLQYIDNWSLGLDLKILILTVPTVLRGLGAS